MLRMKQTAIVILFWIIAAVPARAEFETRASAAYIFDVTTGTILFEKRADAVSYTHLTLPTKA